MGVQSLLLPAVWCAATAASQHLLGVQARAPASLLVQVSSLGPAASQCLKPLGVLCKCAL